MPTGSSQNFRCSRQITGVNGGLMRLLECPQRRSVRDIDAREFKGSSGIIAAAAIELGPMVGKRQQVLFQKCFEAEPRCLKLPLRVRHSSHCGHHVCKAPGDLGVAARNRRDQQRFRVAGSAASK